MAPQKAAAGALAQHRSVVLKLYRDCLRTIRHAAPGHSPKAVALRSTVRNAFKRNQNLDERGGAAAVEAAIAAGVRALSNYLLAASAPADTRLGRAAEDYRGRSVREQRQQQEEDDGGASLLAGNKDEKEKK